MQERQRLRRVEIVVEHRLERTPVAARLARRAKDVAKPLHLRLGLRERLVREVDRLAPVRGHEEEQDDVAPPGVEHVAQRDVVAERLRHLLAGEAEHSVLRPDARELVSERARLRELVLVVREDEVETAAVDLECRPEGVLRHRRTLDVPARPAAPPGRVPRRVLARLVRLPEREVARVLLQRVRLLLLDLFRPLAGEPTVLRVARDGEVDVALDRVCEVALDQLLDELDDGGDRLRGTLIRRSLVDPVVDVGDVVDERRFVAAVPQPRAQPHAKDERARVADVRALVHGRPAEVHPDRPGRRRQLVEPPCERVVEAHLLSLRTGEAARPAAARRSRRTVPARARAR